MSGDRKLLNNLGIMTIGQVAAQLLNLAALVYIARRLGDHDFGLIQVAVVFSGYAMVLAEWGLFSLGIRSVARLDDRTARRDYTARHLGLMLLLACAVFLLGVLLLPLTPFGRADRTLLLLYLGIVFLQTGMLDWLGIGVQKMRQVSQARVMRSLVYALLVLLLWRHLGSDQGKPSYRWLPVMLLFAYLLGNLPLIMSARGWLGGWARPDLRLKQPQRAMFRDAAPISAANLVRRVLFNIDLLLLGLLATPAQAGRYAAAAKLVFVLIVGMEVVLSILLPLFSRWWSSDPALFRRNFRRYLKWLLGLLLPIVLICLVFGEPLTTLIYGGAYPGVGRILGILALSYAMLCVAMLCHEALIAGDRQGQGVLPLITGAVVALVLVLVSIPRWGAQGAACSMLCAHFVYLLFVGYRCRGLLSADRDSALP
jgi:O-antigen/teichoic acid export membrane protein